MGVRSCVRGALMIGRYLSVSAAILCIVSAYFDDVVRVRGVVPRKVNLVSRTGCQISRSLSTVDYLRHLPIDLVNFSRSTTRGAGAGLLAVSGRFALTPPKNEGGGGNSSCACDFVDVEHFENVQASRLTTEDVKMTKCFVIYW